MRDDTNSWVARGAAFGVGWILGVPVVLGLGLVFLVYTLTHSWFLIALVLAVGAGAVNGMIKGSRKV